MENDNNIKIIFAIENGSREVLEPFCKQLGVPYEAMGIIFTNDNEPTLYIAGDTIWCDEVKNAVDKYSPKVIVTNAFGATVKIGEGERLIMDINDIKAISDYAKNSITVASHMDTVSHLTVTREDIKNLKLNNVVVPEDDEILEYR